jgi:predicted metal-dependent peptidase
MKLKLSEFFVYLVQKKSFYGLLASSLERVARPGLGTLAVGLQDGRVILYYDPVFIEQIPFKAALFALEHEMLHLVLDHIPRYFELLALCPTEQQRNKAAAVYNIAMDCAINTLLRKHEGFDAVVDFLKERSKAANPDAVENPMNGMCLPEKWEMPLDQSFEFYQWSLMAQRGLKDLNEVKTGSDHSMWTPVKSGDDTGTGHAQKSTKNANMPPFLGAATEGMSPEELSIQANRCREQLKQALRTAVTAVGGVDPGAIPGELVEWLNDYLAPPIIPWWDIFTSQAKMSRVSRQRRTVATPNRMLLALAEEDTYIMPTPGRVRDKAWRVFVYVDTSGSMSNESLVIVKSELQHMLAVDENMEIRYMQGDCITHADVLLHHGDTIPGEITGRGGTDFDAYFKYMKRYVQDADKAPDIVIVYTDGYATAVSQEHQFSPEIPVLWLVTPTHSSDFNEGYGSVIVCETAHNKRYTN